MHGESELTGIAIVAVAATLCGMLFVRARQPAIVGYIFAGLVLGPSGLGLVEDREAIGLLAELGVLLLLFFIGMELSLRSFRQIWRIALITTLFQIGVSLGLTIGISRFFDWPMAYAVLFGFSLAVSSTAVAVKILEDCGELRNRTGMVAVGILIAQDLAVAPMLIIVTSFAGEGIGPMIFVELGATIAVLVGVILFMSRRARVDLPFHGVALAKKDLRPIAALAWCFLFAVGAGLLGLSPAFGAFLAGLIVGNSAQRVIVHETAEPVQTVLLMVFFLSIGLLINLEFFWDNIWLVIGIAILVTVFKTILNVTLLRLQGEDMQTSFMTACVLGQLGEFSFILGGAAIDANVVDDDVYRLLVAVTVMSLMVSPVYVDLSRRLSHRAAKRVRSPFKMIKLMYYREFKRTKEASGWVKDHSHIPGKKKLDPATVTAKTKEAAKRARDAAKAKPAD